MYYSFEAWFYFIYLNFFLESVRKFHLNSVAIVSNQFLKIFYIEFVMGKGMTNTM